jgi:hypothetical protein
MPTGLGVLGWGFDFVSSGVEIAKNQRFEFGRVSTLSSRLTDPAAVLRPIKAKP